MKSKIVLDYQMLNILGVRVSSAIYWSVELLQVMTAFIITYPEVGHLPVE